MKKSLGINVLDAARERITWTFDNFPKIYISFSGGKDSTVLLHLVMEEAIKRNQKIGVLFIDWECQMSLTINFVEKMYEKYSENIEPYWISLPMKTWNSTSMYEPEWTAWDRNKQDLWARQPNKLSITDISKFPFYYEGQPFEEFVPAFGQWYSQGERCACFVGIRTVESLNRFRTIARDKPTYQGKKYTTNVVNDLWNVYPIYDWGTKDIWIYTGKEKKEYNRLYDRMNQAGLSIHQMRICEPFGDEARKGLWLYQVIEPEMWAKVCLRVAGANTGALYSNEKGSVFGNHHIALPDGHTYESFANHLLKTMPKKTAEHYRNKLAVYINWWKVRGYDVLPETADKSLEASGKAPSWRKICKTLLKNDFWCRGLGFSPTKSTAYKKYCELMKKRRGNWNIYKEELENVG
jgi:predicted phosphoadenosine phosphosulfate sulfurtransferase